MTEKKVNGLEAEGKMASLHAVKNSPQPMPANTCKQAQKPEASYFYNKNLIRRNQALLYVFTGFAVLLYCLTFVRMGQ